MLQACIMYQRLQRSLFQLLCELSCTAISNRLLTRSRSPTIFNSSLVNLISILYTHAQGECVPERDFHVATAVKNKIVVFGGRSDMFALYFTANNIYPSDFYYYELGKYMYVYVWSTDMH